MIETDCGVAQQVSCPLFVILTCSFARCVTSSLGFFNYDWKRAARHLLSLLLFHILRNS